MEQEETKKGPWTEQEDTKLVCFVSLFGERRWDFIAKVSGLNRTGKSCRLRWVNYLHPGLKRGKMTPQEERLVLELHSKLGNRWSRIARKLPGRTDNEIKNYWRTHMRKKAQEMRKRNLKISSSSSSSSLRKKDSSESMSAVTGESMNSFPGDLHTVKSDQSMGLNKVALIANGPKYEEERIKVEVKAYPMEQIWKEIVAADIGSGGLLDENFRFDGGTLPTTPMAMASPTSWDYHSYEDLELNGKESNLWFTTDAHLFNY